jgi:hypothetical protein
MLCRPDESKPTFRNTASIFRAEEQAKQQSNYFTLVSSPDYSSTLKMEVTSSSETLVASKRTAKPHLADDRTRQPRSSLFCFFRREVFDFEAWKLALRTHKNVTPIDTLAQNYETFTSYGRAKMRTSQIKSRRFNSQMKFHMPKLRGNI